MSPAAFVGDCAGAADGDDTDHVAGDEDEAVEMPL
jgi:hypothetical protein